MNTLRDIMTTDVLSVRTSSTIENAAGLLVQHGISGLPVTDEEGQIQGIVTDYSLLSMLFNPSIRTAPVSTIMTTPVVTVSVDESPSDVAEMLVRHSIRRVPVVEDGEIVGIVSRGNLIRGAGKGDGQSPFSMLATEYQPASSPSEAASLLIVDDSAVIHEVIHDALRPTAYRLSFVFSGEEALERIEREPPDLVLLDSVMPGIDGREVLNRLFEEKTGDHLPVIMITSCDRSSHIAEALNAGAIDYVVKPFSAIELQARIASALRTRRYQQQLHSARQEAEEKTRTRSMFLANMSHEIRTPLTAILGFAELLRENQGESETLDSIDRITRNSRHLLEIVNEILDMSKMEVGKLAIDIAPCDPQRIVEEVVDLLQVGANKKGVALAARGEGDIPDLILTDATRLRQILFNIVGNAINYTASGEVKMVTRLQGNESSDTSQIEFAISDTGVGMSPQDLEKVFQAYEQGDRLTRSEASGTGLGLTISKLLAKQLGGDIRVESEKERGTTFYVTVATGPLDGIHLTNRTTGRDASEEALPIERMTRQEALIGCTVLVAEDSLDNQRLIEHILEKAGAKVALACDGEVARELALDQEERSAPFDVILMDMQMPGMSGSEATQQLREKEYQGQIIALTANSSKGAREACLAAGCNDYLAKPFQRESLLQMVLNAWKVPIRTS